MADEKSSAGVSGESIGRGWQFLQRIRIVGDDMSGCSWCLINEKMKKYHDTEWGVPVHDDRKQFEFLMMEVMQCGLNWNMKK